ALRLLLEEQRARQALTNDEEAQLRLAHVGELAGPLAHEFNNLLHVLLLQVAVLEQEVAEELRPELAEIRRQGASVAAVIKEFQHYRRRPQPSPPLLDWNRVVRDTLEVLSQGLNGPGNDDPAGVGVPPSGGWGGPPPEGGTPTPAGYRITTETG